MDFRIYQSKAELKGTDYIKIVRVSRPDIRSGEATPNPAGKYSEKLGQAGLLLIKEDAFLLATGIIVKYFEDYSHFGPNDIPMSAGKKIAAEWEHVAAIMDKMNSEEIISTLHVEGIRNWIDPGIDNYKADIAGMLLSLAEAFNAFYEEGDWIYIEGV